MYIFTIQQIFPRLEKFNFFLIIMNAAIVGSFWLETTNHATFSEITLIFSLLFSLFIAIRKSYKKIQYMMLYFIIQIFTYYIFEQHSLMLILFLIAVLFVYINSPFYISIDGQYIYFKKLFNWSKNWSEFNKIMIKDGRLILDYKNNKIQYYEIFQSNVKLEFEFNNFCLECSSK